MRDRIVLPALAVLNAAIWGGSLGSAVTLAPENVEYRNNLHAVAR